MSLSGAIQPWLSAAIRLSIFRPSLVCVAWALVGMAGVYGTLELDFETSTESVLDRRNPAWAYYRQAVETFGNDEVIVVAIEGQTPFDPNVLAEVSRLSRLTESSPAVRRVDSLSTFPIIRGTPNGDLSLEPAIPRTGSTGPFDLPYIARLARNDLVAPGNLVSPDEHVLAVNLFLDDESTAEQAELLRSLNKSVDPQVTWISGVPIFRMSVNAKTRGEILFFVPITVIVIAGLIYFLFRSIVAVVVTFISVGSGVLLTLGTMGVTGTPLTISTMILPSILLALGSAYTMHVLSIARGLSLRDELFDAVVLVAGPVLLSGATTAIGFVALSAVRIDVIRELGGFGAFGVLATVASTLTLAPALLARWPLVDGRERVFFLQRRLRPAIVRAATTHPYAILGGWAAVALVFLLGVPRLQVETDAVLWFPRGSKVREDFERIRERVAGISPINVVIEAPPERTVIEPAVVQSIVRLTEELEVRADVGRVLSIAEPLMQLNREFSGSGATIPSDQRLIEQYLVLLESMDFIHDVVSRDRSQANVLVRMNDNSSEVLLRLARYAEAWWAENGVDGFTARSTGIMFEFARSEDEIAWGQVRGLVFAVLAIGTVLFLLFRWPAMAAIAILPNVVPLGMIFGFMGFASVPLDAVLVGLGSTALGIAVDDTIHLVSRYCGALSRGRGPVESLDESLRLVTEPLVFTTLAIAGGFAVLGFSDFAVTSQLGQMTAAVVVLCLLADLTLLPPLMVFAGRRRLRGGIAKL